MRAGFARHVNATRPRLSDQIYPAPAADVHDVQRAAGLLREEDGALDGLQFGHHRTRVEVVTHACLPRSHRTTRQQACYRIVLGVHGHDAAQFGRPRHALVQRQVVARLEVVNAAIGHEGLEAHNPALGQFVQALNVARHDAAPQAEVHQRGSLRRCQFQIESGSVNRGRVGVEGHVEEGGRASRCQCARARGKTLPFGAARLVEVQVGVNHTWEDVQPRRVKLGIARALDGGGNLHDPPVGHGDVSLGEGGRGHQGAVADY